MQNIIECNKCKTKFTFSIVDDVYPGGKDRESVNCPKCGHEVTAIITSGFIRTNIVKDSKDKKENKKK